jgi:hypothetical protein
MATAMPAAIRPYSMAVAAFSSLTNLMMRRMSDDPEKELVRFGYWV